ncbi:MAG: DUF3127 domain-containing protein [Prevotella sp.]|nr:DUF3127 domain-containing protein [Prevotella sp.]
MELQGKIIAALPERSGVSQRGEWKSQEFVVETHDTQYSRKLVFTVFGADRLQRFNIQVGQEVNVAFDIDAHEWNGRWFNDIRAYDVRQIDPAQYVSPQPAPAGVQPMGAAPVSTAPQVDASAAPVADSAEDLPF